MTGKMVEVSVKRPGTGTEYSGDNTLLLRDSGLKITPLHDAIAGLYGWYAANPGVLSREQIMNYPL